MWGDSWVNYQLKMKDMPYYSYKKEETEKPGTINDLKTKFSNYIKK